MYNRLLLPAGTETESVEQLFQHWKKKYIIFKNEETEFHFLSSATGQNGPKNQQQLEVI